MKQAQKQPLVSVILPVFNQEDCLRDAIGSILNQTYPQWELLLINNGSTDSSVSIMKGYQEYFSPFIKIFSFTKHYAEHVVINFATRYAKGKFLAHMSADVLAHPQRLEKQVDFLLSHPDTMTVTCPATLISTNNAIIGIQDPPVSASCMYNTSLTSGVAVQLPEPLIAMRRDKDIVPSLSSKPTFLTKKIPNPFLLLKQVAQKYTNLPSVAITLAHKA